MGRYWGRITHQRLGKSSNGNPQIMVSFVVLGKVNVSDPDGDLLPVMQQYERTVFRVITENTIDWVTQDLDKLSWVGDDWATFDEGHPSCCQIVGNELGFFCKHEAHYQTGEPREVWSIAQDNMGPTVIPLESSELRKLNALFGKALKARANVDRKEAPVCAPVPKAAVTQTGDDRTSDDDIPF